MTPATLRAVRASLGMTAAGLAAVLAVDPRTGETWEADEREA